MISSDLLLLLKTDKKPAGATDEPTPTTGTDLWGVADLHAHPASHFAFGADINGNNGPFWGKPGGNYSTSRVQEDLPACDACKHCGYDDDVVRHETRKSVVGQMEKDIAWAHGHKGDGWPTYGYWPKADSLSHQQMHVSAIHRAWHGGLRLMVASVTDSQVLAMLWNRHYAASYPVVDPNYDYNSAKRQLSFLTAFAQNNASWMKIVKSSAEAYTAINSGKLAVVLALEMDNLSVSQIMALTRDYGVRLVTPLHLVDNSFGGAAVYDPLFNIANRFLNEAFFSVEEDTSVTFRFQPFPQYLRYVSNNLFDGGDLIKCGAMVPAPFRDMVYQPGIPPFSPGHRNAVGLKSEDAIKQLMAKGLMIDITHMSQNTVEDVLAIAENFAYPLTATHTGMRQPVPSTPTGIIISENQLKVSHVQRVSALGGIIGYGTGHNDETRLTPIHSWDDGYHKMFLQNGNRPIGLGTDMNGLSRQIRFTDFSSNVPLSIPYPAMTTTMSPENAAQTAGIDASQEGQLPVTIDYGINHYGMIPEFINAVSGKTHGDATIRALFKSADAFLKMWKGVETACTNVN